MPDGQFYAAILWYHLVASCYGMCVPGFSFCSIEQFYGLFAWAICYLYMIKVVCKKFLDIVITITLIFATI